MRRVPLCGVGLATSSLCRRLILVRHGAVDRERAEPPIRPGAFYGGNVDVPLSALGEAEAVAAARLITAEHGGRVQRDSIFKSVSWTLSLGCPTLAIPKPALR